MRRLQLAGESLVILALLGAVILAADDPVAAADPSSSPDPSPASSSRIRIEARPTPAPASLPPTDASRS